MLFKVYVSILGNHDLWVKGSKNNSSICSFSKLDQVLSLCTDFQVCTGLLELYDGQSTEPSVDSNAFSQVMPTVKILPLMSWYHSGWDTEPNISHPDFLKVEEVSFSFSKSCAVMLILFADNSF